MNPQRRQLLAVMVLLVVLAGAAWWSVDHMLEARRHAMVMAQDLVACRQYAESIEQLRAQPMVATAQDMGVQELGERIEAAMKQAELPAAVLEGVVPQAGRRVGDTPYVHKPTSLSLRGTTMTQLVTFLYHLTSQTGLTVRDLRLRLPRTSTDTKDQWDAQVTVMYLLYSPTSRGERGNRPAASP